MGEVDGQANLLSVGGNDIGIVAVALKIDNPLDIKSDEFVTGIEIQSLLSHWSCFSATGCLRCGFIVSQHTHKKRGASLCPVHDVEALALPF